MVLRLEKPQVEEFMKKVNFDKGKGLVPVVIQDASNNRVLMQAFMNKETLHLTLTSGRMHYWSRSRQRIWLKGEESGHYSLLQNAILDCDSDAILFKVQQMGSICHTGEDTCFHTPILSEQRHVVDAKMVERVSEVIWDRIRHPLETSYVSQLTAKGEDAVLQKIGEEAVELILATKENHPKEIVHETTDILFHLMVLLAQKDIKLNEIFKELDQRHKTKTRSIK